MRSPDPEERWVRRRCRPWLVVVLFTVVLAVPGVAAVAQEADVPETEHDALTVLPPGNSMLYTADSQARGTATGNPDDFGDHVDDQREMYWGHEFKDGGFRDICDDPETPRAGVRICWDDAGVPIIYGDTGYDVWWGAGYAVAQIRLFLMDAIRRTARGTLAELTGPSAVPADVQTRVLGYTEDEYAAMANRLDEASVDALDGYRDGVNAWIGEVTTSAIDRLPAEYAVLSSQPETFTRADVLATGVLMTRTVASNGGNEFANVAALRALEEAFGTEAGRGIFNDLLWVEDRGAVVTVPEEEGVFPRTTLPADRRPEVFDRWADYAATLPLELAEGPGTGAYPTPEATDAQPAAPEDLGASAAAAALDEWRAALDGGSFMVAISPERTATGEALLMSEPQLGYNPTLLVELEVHGAGYDARGVSVPGIPTVGIGYTDRVAWALTTGNAKTITSFVETTRPGTDGAPPQYRHDGAWKDAICRVEEVRYRAAPEGVPAGPAAFAEDVEVCRTVHGPIVAATEDGSMARSVQYDMWQREVETVEGVLAWNRAKNLEQFEAAMRKVTWNENTGYADADGHIAFWHPGLHAVHHAETDLRLPVPGTGEYDLQGLLAFGDLPHVVDPAQGWIANWNNKPAHGWLDGEGMGVSSYPAGHGQRVTNLTELLPTRSDWTFEDLRAIDRRTGSEDVRAKEFVPLLLDLANRDDLDDLEREALDLLADWDWSANGPGADMSFAGYQSGEPATVGAAPTIFNATMDALLQELFADVRTGDDDLVARQSNKGRHVYDMGPVENLALRILDPDSSSLTPSRDYAGGRAGGDVLLAALRTAVWDLADAQGEDPATWRSAYEMNDVCSPTGGVVGPCGQMPFLERGTWIHLVGFTASTVAPAPAPTDTATPRARPARERPLPTTGGGATWALGCVLGGLLLARVSRRRRRKLP